jgi:signal transduction histidine kinase
MAIIVVLLMGLLACSIIFIACRKRLRKGEHLRMLEGMRSGHENVLLQSQLEIQENTFQHIAREIHDNIGQKLTLAKLQLSSRSEAGREEPTTLLTDCYALISEAISGLSQLSHNMGTDTIMANGFVKAIEAELRHIDKISGFTTSLNITGKEYFLKDERELILFRIAQECLTNILKHACASHINVDVHFNSNHLQLDIGDNGKGFKVDERNCGSGIHNIRSRTGLLEGNCRITSNINGTLVQLRIPYHEKQEQGRTEAQRQRPRLCPSEKLHNSN